MAEGEQAFVYPPHLPPREAWKVNPDTLRKFFAPTDDRGFVIPDATVEVVRELFEDDYEWPIDLRHQETRPDVHHFHWIARRYDPKEFNGRTAPHRFRELPTVKGIVPRQFHNAIHQVTLPPAMPRYKDMARHVHAYQIAQWLFSSATNAAEAQNILSSSLVADSQDAISNEMLIRQFDRQFRGYRLNMERLLGATGLEMLRLDDPKFSKRKPHEVTKLLGRVVRNREINYVPLFKTAA
ncbi:MAG TPA: hypothetical protein VGE13_02215 [Candidatus Saccharimonadales bacterium]